MWPACCWQPSYSHEEHQPKGGANAVFGRAEGQKEIVLRAGQSHWSIPEAWSTSAPLVMRANESPLLLCDLHVKHACCHSDPDSEMSLRCTICLQKLFTVPSELVSRPREWFAQNVFFSYASLTSLTGLLENCKVVSGGGPDRPSMAECRKLLVQHPWWQ